uniref:THAP-type domain-containing protein n=1 Tax=Latimeria chalumnae TaxID=7897 RepID=H2ZWN1_LATCH
MPNFCAAPNCRRKSTQLEHIGFFRFPRDPERCRRWVENCGRKDLWEKTPDQLNKYYRLCSTHFEAPYVSNRSAYRIILRDDAIPTIFEHTAQFNDPQNRHQTKELSEELEHLKLKKIDVSDSLKGKEKKECNEINIQSIIKEEEFYDVEPVLLSQEEKEEKEYLRSLFEILTVMGKQNIPLEGHEAETPDGIFTPGNFQALLDLQINAGDEVLRKRFEMTAVNMDYCSKVEQKQMLQVCESCIREEILREIRDSRFFSVVAGEEIDVAGEEHLPLFIRFVDKSNDLKEEFIEFFPCRADAETLAVQLHMTITEKWGLNMEYCRGQAYVSSSRMAAKMKTVAARLLEKHPQATLTSCCSCALNIFLAKSVPVSGVTFLLEIMEQISMFFNQSPQLQAEMDKILSLYFQNHEEEGRERKTPFCCQWIERHDAFEIMVDLLEALVTCLDGITNSISGLWSNPVKTQANVLSTVLTEFESVISLVVLKNALSFTVDFGKNLQGKMWDVFFAANNLKAILTSLNEVLENIEIYHDFWFEEATNLAVEMGILVKLPRRCWRNQPDVMNTNLLAKGYYKEELSIPVVKHIIQELKDIFSENHLKALKCLSFVPSVMGQVKFNTCEESNADLYTNDLPNPDMLSAELNCWRIKWKLRGKDVKLPSTICDTLHLPDIQFFPNMYTLLKILCILPVIKVESDKFETGRSRLRAYLKDTPKEHRSNSLALLNVNYDANHDLDLMVNTYLKMFPEKIQL